MFLVGGVCFALAFVLGNVHATDCPDGWVAFRGSCYWFVHDRASSFVEAEHLCGQHNSHLVTIENATENSFLKDFLSAFKAENHWIGLTDETVEGIWEWYNTKSTPGFVDWRPGEPDSYKRDEDCAAFASPYHYQWVDLGCNEHYEPLCEMEVDDMVTMVLG